MTIGGVNAVEEGGWCAEIICQAFWENWHIRVAIGVRKASRLVNRAK